MSSTDRLTGFGNTDNGLWLKEGEYTVGYNQNNHSLPGVIAQIIGTQKFFALSFNMTQPMTFNIQK